MQGHELQQLGSLHTTPLCFCYRLYTFFREWVGCSFNIFYRVLISLAAAAYSKRDCEAEPAGHLGKD